MNAFAANVVTLGSLKYQLDGTEAYVYGYVGQPTDVEIPGALALSGGTYFVTRIGGSAFYNCSSLTSVEIPNSVTSIYYNAFSGCSGLRSVTIGNSVTSIGSSAFTNCSGLTSVTIPNSVTSIDYNAFYGCSGLTSVTIGNSVKSIGNDVFYGCSDLKYISINSGNTKYDSRNNCNAIIDTSSNTLIVGCKNTIIPNSVTSIGNNAFRGCSGLQSMTIPNSVTSIGNSAFQGCSSLTSVTIGNSVTSIGNDAFYKCSGLNYISVNSGNTKYDSRNNCNAIIETSSNTLIVGCKNTIIPSSVTSIGNYAFRGCSGLTSVTIPNSVTSIGSSAFEGCSSLANIISEITSPFAFGSNAFKNISVCTLTVPANTKEQYISAGWTTKVFEGGIIDLSEPEIIYLGTGNSFTAKTIEGVDVRFMVTDTSQRTVQVGVALANEYWQTSKVAIDSSTSGSVTIPEKVVYGGIEYLVTYIANAAFMNCSKLTNITIPESVTHIGHAAFDHCSGLTSIYIPNSVTSFDDGYVFVDCINLLSVRLSGNMKVLPNDTFTRCSSLTTITIPDGVANLGIGVVGDSGDAFWNCSALTSVIIPSSVTYYVGNSFSECTNLKIVIVRRPEPVSIDNCSFQNRKNATLYVPKGSKTAYENAAVWKEFKEIIEAPESFIDFADANVESLCVANWDTSGDGKLDYEEAAAVTKLNGLFKANTSITSFDELQFFTGLYSIGEDDFLGCSSLNSVTIPSGVASIGKSAFKNCSGLISVTVGITEPLTISSSTFTNRTNATLYVPKGSKAAYKAATYWKDFKSIVEFTPFIDFADANVKTICVAKWDTNGDGELSCEEAAAVTSLNGLFGSSGITSFDELQYFTGLINIANNDFQKCWHLTSVTIPSSVTSIGNSAFSGCSGLSSVALTSDLQ
jgi:hypothetical protein